MMNCKHVEELMADALDSELGAADQEAFERHLGSCAACHSQYERSKNTLEALRRLAAPPEVAIRREGDRLLIESSDPRRTLRVHQWLRYAACILVAFVAGYVAAGRDTLRPAERTDIAQRISLTRTEPVSAGASGETLEAAIAAVHLRHPNESPLTKCLLALAEPGKRPGR